MEIKLTNVRALFRKRLLMMIMRTFIFLMCTTLFSFTSNNSFSQTKIQIDKDQLVTVDQVFKIIKQQTSYNFLYPKNLFKNKPKVQLQKGEIFINELLKQSLSDNKLSYYLTKENTIVIKDQIAPNNFQQQIVSGKVTDNASLPIIGVTVLIKGTLNGTTTNDDGKYKISLKKGDTLSFSYIGYKQQEIVFSNQTEINIVLKEEAAALNEVVLVGYSTKSRKDIISSISKINVNAIENTAAVTLDNALAGQASGVYVVSSSGEPGTAAKIRIRGITSVLGNNEPLYVIDGIPFEIGQGLGNDVYANSFNNSFSPLASINPQDIKSIDILKDASATAIYGSRGANGVVIVTTKKGSYSSIPSIKISSSTRLSNFAKEYNMLNAKELNEVIERAYINSGTPLPANNALFPYGQDIDTNWKKETDQLAISENYYINVNGGSLVNKTLYSISANTLKEKGAIYNTYFKRNNIRTRLETELSKDFRIGTNFNYSDSKKRGSNMLNYYEIVTYSPVVPVFDELGAFGTVTGGSTNPYAKARYKSNITDQNLTLSLFGEYKLTNQLIVKSQYSYNKSNGKSFSYTPSYDNSQISLNRKGTLFQSDTKFSTRTFDNTINFSKKINRHNVSSVVGASYTQTKSEFLNIQAIDFPDDDISITPGAASKQTISTGGTISGLESYFLSMNYNFSDKYYATFTGRADKSTKFGPNNRWGYFPSGALSWRISKENFLDNNESINDLKLRISYGKTGSANFSDFQYATFFETGSYYNNQNGVISNTIPNPDIKWETTNQLDLAMDFSLIDRRINGTFGYFEKKTLGQILYKDIGFETGGKNQFSNIGDFSNKGFEFKISADIFTSDKFQWTTELNLSTIKSKVLKLNGGYYRDLKEGESIGIYRGYITHSIFQNQSEIDVLNTASPSGVYQSTNTAPGDFKFVDINNDGYINSNDVTKIGSPEPDIFGGFINTLRFGGFEIYALFNFSIGNYAVNNNRQYLQIFNGLGTNYEKKILDAWTIDNSNSDIPRIVNGDPNNNGRLSNFYIEDASFLKLKALNFKYKINPKILEKYLFKTADISFSVSNVFVITSYSGLDPEVNYLGGNFSQGWDSAKYPPSRTFTLGINLSL
ncbi:TonB-dependent receptor [Flavobacteriaceae bacterium F08102]|nr:TonB-dependent receptor [Flavobacteriaceae bacterium F08102]